MSAPKITQNRLSRRSFWRRRNRPAPPLVRSRRVLKRVVRLVAWTLTAAIMLMLVGGRRALLADAAAAQRPLRRIDARSDHQLHATIGTAMPMMAAT